MKKAKKPKRHYIYHLVDPNTRQIKYVGNSVNPKGRLRVHVQDATTRQNTEKKVWIKALLNRGQSPILVIVAEYNNEPDARRRESREVHKHKATVTNLHDPAKGAKDIRQRTENETTKDPDAGLTPRLE